MTPIGRRQFLQLSMAGGVLTAIAPATALSSAPDRESAVPVGIFVRFRPDNSCSIGSPTTEMGQGVLTSMAMIVAEELDADWSRVTVEAMPLALRRVQPGEPVSDVASGEVDYAHAYQGSGGSQSTAKNYAYLRRVGADLRARFVRAAAVEHAIPEARLSTRDGEVIDASSGRRFTYASLAAAAARLPGNDPASVRLKPESEFRLIGRPQRLKEARDLVVGRPVFGIDRALPGMVHALVLRPPHFRGRVQSVDEWAARATPGVLDVVVIHRSWPGEDRPADSNVELIGGVAVIAETLWAAMKGRAALKVAWSPGAFDHEDTAWQRAMMRRSLQPDAPVLAHRTEGDVDAAMATAARVVEAEYSVEPLAHVCMEPLNAIADMRPDRPHIVAPHQFPDTAARAAAELCGFDPLAVRVEAARMGGGFGRKATTDFVSEAIHLSKQVGRPVKVTWTREDDIASDKLNPACLHHVRAGLDGDGRVIAYDFVRASPGFGFKPDEFPAGITPNYRARMKRTPELRSGATYGAWRAPGNNVMAFSEQSFMDELAHAAGVDPLEFRLRWLGAPRSLAYPGYGAATISTGRMADVLRLAARKAGWGRPTPDGVGRGIAGAFTFGSYCAHVMEVRVVDGRIEILKVVSAVDCGRPVNPLGIVKQIEGGVNDGVSTALRLGVTLDGGRVHETNLDAYPVMRIADAPRAIEVHLVASAEPPSGVGELALPPAIPALTNAIFAATGRRIRRLPIADQLRVPAPGAGS